MGFPQCGSVVGVFLWSCNSYRLSLSDDSPSALTEHLKRMEITELCRLKIYSLISIQCPNIKTNSEKRMKVPPRMVRIFYIGVTGSLLVKQWS